MNGPAIVRQRGHALFDSQRAERAPQRLQTNRSKDGWFYGVYRLKRRRRLFRAERTLHGAPYIDCSESRCSWRGPVISRQRDEAQHQHHLHPQSANRARIQVQNEPYFKRFGIGFLWSLSVTKWRHIFMDDTATKCAAATTTSSTPRFGVDAKRHDERTTIRPLQHRDDAAHHGAECM